MVNIFKAMKAPDRQLVVFFLSNERLNKNCNYYLNPTNTFTFIPFKLLDSQSSLYVTLWNNFTHSFKIYMISVSNTQMKLQGQEYTKKGKIVRCNNSNYKMHPKDYSWKIPAKYTLRTFFLDFKGYGGVGFAGYSLGIPLISKSAYEHYYRIRQYILVWTMNSINSVLAPLDCLRVIYGLFDFLLRTPSVTKYARALVGEYLQKRTQNLYTQIKLKNWGAISQLIISIFACLLVSSDKKIFIEETLLGKYFKPLTLLETNSLVQSIAIVVGENIQMLKNTIRGRIIAAKSPLLKYRYLLWYNLLHCALQDKNQKVRTQLNSATSTTTNLRELFQLTTYDIKFKKFNRAIPMESKLLSSIFRSKYGHAHMMVTERFRLIKELVNSNLLDLQEVYKLFKQFKNDFAALYKDDVLLFFDFLFWILNIAQIPKNKRAVELTNLTGTQNYLLSLMSELLLQQILKVNDEQTGNRFFKLLMTYEGIVDEKVKLYMIKNPFIVNQIRFIRFFEMILNRQSPNTYKKNLKHCTSIWLARHGLMQTTKIYRQFNFNFDVIELTISERPDTHSYLPTTVKDKCNLIADNKTPKKVREIIGRSFNDINFLSIPNDDVQHILGGAQFLLRNKMVNVCDLMLTALFKKIDVVHQIQHQFKLFNLY